jgi:hypothetical protein
MPPSFHPYAEKPMDTGMEGWKEPSKRPFTPIIHTLHSLPPHSPLSKQAMEGWKEGWKESFHPSMPLFMGVSEVWWKDGRSFLFYNGRGVKLPLHPSFLSLI